MGVAANQLLYSTTPLLVLVALVDWDWNWDSDPYERVCAYFARSICPFTQENTRPVCVRLEQAPIALFTREFDRELVNLDA